MADQETIWRYVSAAEYVPPSDLSSETLRGFRRVWKSALGVVRRAKDSDAEPPPHERPSAELLTGVLPELDAEEMARALGAALEERHDLASGAARAGVVVGPPGSHLGEVMTALARGREWRELEPPPRVELLGGAEEVRKQLEALEAESDRPTVISQLDRWLLRSESALPAVRSMLERVRGMPSPVLVGCDSWAWSFLDHTVGVGDLLGEPLTLAALDARALAGWLGPPLRSKGFACRSTGKRNEVIFGPPADPRNKEEGETQSVPATLVRLASAARGNPGVALDLWRRCLRLGTEERKGEGDVETERQNALWTSPLHELDVVIPSRLAEVHRFVLHAVLVHGGLERELLTEVLPFPRHDLLRRIRDVVNEGLLEEREGELRVPINAYTAVRGHLKSEGFLVDGF